MPEFRRTEVLDNLVTGRRVIALVEWPDDRVAEGRGVTPKAALAAAMFLPSGIPSDEVAGSISARQDPPEVRYHPDPGVTVLTVYSSADSKGVTVDDGGRSVTVALDGPPVVLRLSNGRHIELAQAPSGGFTVHELTTGEGRPIPLEPPPDTVLEGNPDRWLCAYVRLKWSVRDPWHLAMGAGMAAKNTSSVGRDWRTVALESSWPHAWFGTLTAEQAGVVEEGARLAITSLGQDCAHLERTFDPEDLVWRQALVGWCKRRDDLEGVMVLLDLAGRGKDLHRVLTPFDETAAAFVRAIPLVFDVDDEQLRRAARFDPDHWWALTAIRG